MNTRLQVGQWKYDKIYEEAEKIMEFWCAQECIWYSLMPRLHFTKWVVWECNYTQ